MRQRLKRLYTAVTGHHLPSTPRGQYKDVWTRMSRRVGDARSVVQGSKDDAELDRTAEQDLVRLGRHLTFDASTDILEIGCGVGRLGTVFAPRCRTWTGCDVSPHMLTHAGRRLAQFPNVRFVELSGYDLAPIPEASVDVVYCTVVFMHLSEWDRYSYILDARRVLRPGGRLYVDNMSLTTGTGWQFFLDSAAVDPRERPSHIGQTSTPQEFEVYLQRAGYSRWHVEVADDAWVVGVGVK